MKIYHIFQEKNFVLPGAKRFILKKIWILFAILILSNVDLNVNISFWVLKFSKIAF